MKRLSALFALPLAFVLAAIPARATDLSDYAENAALTALVGTGSFQVRLHTADPGETCAANELAVANGYTRQTVTFTVVASTADNDAQAQFGPATADQGTVTHFSVFDGTGTNCIFKDALTASRAWPSGTLTIAAGALTLTLD